MNNIKIAYKRDQVPDERKFGMDYLMTDAIREDRADATAFTEMLQKRKRPSPSPSPEWSHFGVEPKALQLMGLLSRNWQRHYCHPDREEGD